MNWMNVFLVGCFWICLPIVYVTMRNNTLRKNNLVLSVTLPPGAMEDTEVTACIARFRKHLLWSMLVLTAALVPALFLPWVSVSTTWCMIWLLAAMFVSFWVYGKSYNALKAIKRRRGWQTGSAGKTIVELQDLKLPKPMKTGWFVPPMILSVLPVLSCILDDLDAAWGTMLLTSSLTCLLVTAGSLATYGVIFRQKADMVDDNPDRTAALTRVRRYNWTKTWLWLAWLTGIYSMAVWIAQGKGYVVITLIYTVLLLAIVIATEFAVRRAQQRLNGNAAPILDEDDYWIWGQFYYNPNSKKVFINERVGMGMSVNIATPVGKAITIFSVVLLVSMLPLCGWLMTEELTPITLVATEQAVIATQIGEVYNVPLSEVTHAELLEELPRSAKAWGTDLTNLLKGTFSVEGYGTARFCLDPHDPPFLVLHTEHDIYFFSGKQAEDIYRQINLDK